MRTVNVPEDVGEFSLHARRSWVDSSCIHTVKGHHVGQFERRVTNKTLFTLANGLARSVTHLQSAVGKTITIALSVLVVSGFIAAFTLLSHGPGASHTGADSSGIPNSTAPSATTTGVASATCGTATTPSCLSASGDWIPISSDAPAAVLAAFKQSGMYAATQTGVGDGQPDLSHPETPVFERELHIPGGLIEPDMYVIPFDTADGSIGWFALCNVNATHTAIEVSEIVPGGLPNGQPRPHGQLTPISASAAAAAMRTQRGVQLRVGAQPSLVFVEINANLIETGQVKWSAPAGPQNPYWLVSGADGHDYLVDTTGKAHLLSEVPIEMAPVGTPPA